MSNENQHWKEFGDALCQLIDGSPNVKSIKSIKSLKNKLIKVRSLCPEQLEEDDNTNAIFSMISRERNERLMEILENLLARGYESQFDITLMIFLIGLISWFGEDYDHDSELEDSLEKLLEVVEESQDTYIFANYEQPQNYFESLTFWHLLRWNSLLDPIRALIIVRDDIGLTLDDRSELVQDFWRLHEYNSFMGGIQLTLYAVLEDMHSQGTKYTEASIEALSSFFMGSFEPLSEYCYALAEDIEEMYLSLDKETISKGRKLVETY